MERIVIGFGLILWMTIIISRGDKSVTMPLIGWDRVMAPMEMETFARTLEEYLPYLVEHLYGLSPEHHKVILTHD